MPSHHVMVQFQWTKQVLAANHKLGLWFRDRKYKRKTIKGVNQKSKAGLIRSEKPHLTSSHHQLHSSPCRLLRNLRCSDWTPCCEQVVTSSFRFLPTTASSSSSFHALTSPQPVSSSFDHHAQSFSQLFLHSSSSFILQAPPLRQLWYLTTIHQRLGLLRNLCCCFVGTPRCERSASLSHSLFSSFSPASCSLLPSLLWCFPNPTH